MDFEEHVRRALESLPRELREAMSNIEIVVEDENPEDPDLFGLYLGIPLPDRHDYAGVLPDKIAVYRLPLEDEFGDDPQRLEEEIRVTVLHEVAHHFGIDEDRLGELVTCPYCVGVWIASGLTYALVVFPRETRVVTTIFSGQAVADFLNAAFVKPQQD